MIAAGGIGDSLGVKQCCRWARRQRKSDAYLLCDEAKTSACTVPR